MIREGLALVAALAAGAGGGVAYQRFTPSPPPVPVMMDTQALAQFHADFVALADKLAADGQAQTALLQQIAVTNGQIAAAVARSEARAEAARAQNAIDGARFKQQFDNATRH